MSDLSLYMLVITLNVNDLIHQLEVRDWSVLKKYDPTTCCLYKTHFKYNDKGRMKVKGQEKLYHANINQRNLGVAIIISD